MKRLCGFGIAVVALAALFGLGGGQASAAQVSCGEVITQDTKVDNDVIDCPGDGLVVGADDITLDLNGHTIDGVGKGRGIAVGEPPAQSGPQRVTIQNGTVRQFRTGVWLWYGDGAHLQKLEVSGSVSISRSYNVTVEKNRLSDGGIDIYEGQGAVEDNRITHGGIAFGHGSSVRVEGNLILAPSAGSGIFVADASAGKLVHNRVLGGAVGIAIGGHSGNGEIKNNVVANNSDAGISLSTDEVPSRIEQNTVYGNGEGIRLFHEPFGDLVTGNRVFRNRGNGISAESVGLMVGNRVYQNGGDGIAGGETMVANRVFSNGGNGIRAEGGRLVQDNVAARNGLDGIFIGPGFRGSVTGNTVRANGDDGIDVEESAGDPIFTLAWAPGRRIAYTELGDVYTLNPDGSARVRISNGGGEVIAPPVWSPDGNHILFWGSGGHGGLYAANGDDSGLTQLSPATTGQAWSPDGTKIAFTQPNALFTIDPNGANERRITGSPYSIATPAWSPDGRRIAFSGLFGGDSKIFVVNADGSGFRSLTVPPSWSNSPTFSTALTWTADGAEVLALHDGEAFAIKADGSGFRTIASDVLRNVLSGAFSVSPDGTRIAFSRYADDSFAIYTMNRDGTDQRRLADGIAPHWSPNGTRIAFLAPVEQGGNEVAVINPDGTGLTRLHEAHVTITRNRAYRNGDLGIESVPIVVDGGDNVAFFNGNPLQCLNIQCK